PRQAHPPRGGALRPGRRGLRGGRAAVREPGAPRGQAPATRALLVHAAVRGGLPHPDQRQSGAAEPAPLGRAGLRRDRTAAVSGVRRMTSRPLRVGFVVPRYGDDIVGGAETLVRGLAEHLAAAGSKVEVLTTCAPDHLTWKNAVRPGVSLVRGVVVRRFPLRPRDERRPSWLPPRDPRGVAARAG